MLRLSLRHIRWNRAGEVLTYGSMFFFTTAGNSMVSATVNRLFLMYGSELHVSAFTAVASVGSFLLCAGMGMTAVNATMSGIFYGEENRDALSELIRCSRRKILKVNLVLMLAAFLAAPVMLVPFITDPEIKKIAVYGLRMYAIQLIPHGSYMSMIGYMKGTGRVRAGKALILISSLSTCLFQILFVAAAGIDMIWISYTFAFLFSNLCFLLYASRISGKLSVKAEDLILQPESFGPPPEDVMEQEAVTLEDVTAFTNRAADFVKEHKGSDRQILMVPLCIEEMAANVIQHGFNDGKDHYFGVKIIANKEGYTIRMRDDCKPFNPKEFYEMHQPKDPELNIGIRMVYKMAKEVNYLNTLRMNNLIIKI